jgi:hypothetical protein
MRGDMRLDAIPARRSVAGAMVAVLAGLLTISGWAIGTEHAGVLFAAMAVVGLGVCSITQRGAFIGVLLLAIMNGLPFVDTSTAISGKTTLQDIVVVVLVVAVGVWILVDGTFHCPTRVGRAISQAGVLLLLWWLWILTRTVALQGVHIRAAADFNRDLGFFALFLILLPRVRLKNRDIGVLLGVLLAGVCLFAAAQIATAFGFGAPGSLLHVDHTLQQSGLTRVYANMTDLVIAGLAASVAASLAARQRWVRLFARPVALLLTLSIVVQLTRARWVGLVVALIVVGLWLAFSGDARIPSAVRRRLALVVCLLLAAGLALFFAAPSIFSNGTVIQRLLSIASDLQSNSGTVAVRESVTRTMTAYLGGHWLSGLGFVPPSAHYYVGLPFGSIQDPDLGVLNAVMTTGVIGAALIYLPIVLVGIYCLHRSSAPLITQYDWLRYGGAIWVVATLISSVTLVTLFSTSGLVLSAVFLMILAHPSVCGDPVQISAVSSALDSSAIPTSSGHRNRSYQGRAAPASVGH